VVSGLAALIRARFPAMTARQVMRRIETTAHHPPSGWDPVVGNGTVDPLAAVSTGSGPARKSSGPSQVPITASPQTRPRDSRARDTALRGAGICLVALALALATGAIRGRLRRARDRIASD
jgi:membrane-anchored mycosin MYCP